MSSTDLTHFRNQYLTKAQDRLLLLDIPNASDTDLLLNSALLKAYDAVNQFDTLGPGAVSLLDGMGSGVLETWIADPSNRQAFETVAASSTAMAAVAASSTAMAAVAASNVASDACFTSSSARLAIYNSDAALSAFQANPTQVQRQIDTVGRTSTGSTASSSFTYVPNGTKVILLRRFYGGRGRNMT
jgi:hypothetical protein